ncbi:MAG TPA: hypothetical protein VGQ35_12275 [Dongiaceae bacterium]|nr:hypothetical protein [Dongiaceae bacterium]
MWPYTHDEVTWLALPRERAVAETAQRALDQAWMAEIGIMRQPANDALPGEIRMIDPRR